MRSVDLPIDISVTGSTPDGDTVGINVGVTPSDLASGIGNLAGGIKRLFNNDGNTSSGASAATLSLTAVEAVVANDAFTANVITISIGKASAATISGNTITGSTADASTTITDSTISGSGAAISADPNSVVERSGNSFDVNADGDPIVQEAPLTRIVTLGPNWNLVGWTSLTMAFDEVLSALTGRT